MQALHAAVCLLFAGAAMPASADVVTDGSVGSRVRLNGDFAIGADLGTRAGRNLFHSFERFSLATGERATFSGPNQIRNVISRVTGGARSEIDGTIRSTIPGADFYFLNPKGVMFGPNASLDLQGSFHVSTADELRFADGAKFSAANLSASSFTVAAPEAFGFLGGRPGNIVVDRSTLEVPASESFSIVGGDITIDGGDSGGEQGRVLAEGGAISLLASGGGGDARIADGRLTSGSRSDVTLKDQASIDVSGDGGGTVRIAGGQIVMSDGSGVVVLNRGSANATGGVFVVADALKMKTSSINAAALGAGDAGAVTITADRIELREAGRIDSETIGDDDPSSEDGDAGPVMVTAGSIEISGSSEIASDTFSDGDAGAMIVAADRIELRDGGGITSSTRTGDGDAGSVAVRASELDLRAAVISSETTSESLAADGGSVTIVVDSLEFSDFGRIGSSSAGGGNAGSVTVRAESIEVSGLSSIESFASARFDGQPNRAGSVVVRADRLVLRDNGAIDTFIGGPGFGGTVSVAAREIELRNGGRIDSSSGRAGRRRRGIGDCRAAADRGGDPRIITGVTADSFQAGAGGTVTVVAEEIELRSGGAIRSGTFRSGDAGEVTVRANRLLVDGARSQAETEFSRTGVLSDASEIVELTGERVPATGDAGKVSVTASDIELREGGTISSATLGPGDAGSVTVAASVVTLVDGGSIASFSDGTGEGGSVTIRADDTFRSTGASVTARAAETNAGDIVITAGRLIDLVDSEVTTSAAEGEGSGGNILIDPEFVVVDGSRIVADAREGAGGSIRVVADNFVATPDSLVDASSDLGIDGSVEIAAPDVDLAGGLVILKGALLDVASQLRERCASRRDIGASSFTGVGRGGLPASPDAPLTSRYSDTGVGEAPVAAESGPVDETALPPRARLAALARPCRPWD
jgi:filamentous hemagglutinin family protein